MSKMTTEKTKSPRFVRFDISGDDEGDEKEPEFEIEDDGTIAALSTPTLLAVTCSAGGLQIIWSTLFSNGSVCTHLSCDLSCSSNCLRDLRHISSLSVSRSLNLHLYGRQHL